MTALDNLLIDVTVCLGRTTMPLQQLLKLGRGAVVELDGTDADIVDILVHGHRIARGSIVVSGRAISIQVTEMLRNEVVDRQPGARIGGRGLTGLPGFATEPATKAA